MSRLDTDLHVFAMQDLKGSVEHAAATLAEIDAILHPVEVEEVLVERWTFGDGCDTFDTEEQARHNSQWGGEVYKLTGVRRRDKKVVERRVEIKGATFVLDNSAPHFCQKILAPWSDDVPTGKTGTLTFEWTRGVMPTDYQVIDCGRVKKKLSVVDALREMLALWERVHRGTILGKPTVNAAKKVLAQFDAAQTADRAAGGECEWVYPHDMEQQGEMLSQCGVRSYFNVNDDVQDGFKFCPYCGKPIHVK